MAKKKKKDKDKEYEDDSEEAEVPIEAHTTVKVRHQAQLGFCVPDSVANVLPADVVNTPVTDANGQLHSSLDTYLRSRCDENGHASIKTLAAALCYKGSSVSLICMPIGFYDLPPTERVSAVVHAGGAFVGRIGRHAIGIHDGIVFDNDLHFGAAVNARAVADPAALFAAIGLGGGISQARRVVVGAAAKGALTCVEMVGEKDSPGGSRVVPTDGYDTEADQVDDEECDTETDQVDDEEYDIETVQVDDESCFSSIIQRASCVDPVIRAYCFASLRVILIFGLVCIGLGGFFTRLAPYLERGNRLMEVECISLTGLKNQTLQLSIEGCDVALSEPATSLNPDGPLASWNNLPPGLLHANHLHDLHGVQNPRGTASTNPFLHGWPW
jgi:hypothetical protein